MNNTNVCLAWATRVRHIAVDGVILCQYDRKTTGYAVSNGQYNTISLSGLPDYRKEKDDEKHTHTDGVIDFKPLPKSPPGKSSGAGKNL